MSKPLDLDGLRAAFSLSEDVRKLEAIIAKLEKPQRELARLKVAIFNDVSTVHEDNLWGGEMNEVLNTLCRIYQRRHTGLIEQLEELGVDTKPKEP